MVDYTVYFLTSDAVKRELEAIAKLQAPHINSMILPTPSKRQARLNKMFWIYRKEGK